MIPPSVDEELSRSLGGRIRLFPLPNYVFFPNVVKGLHIFEPRYCAMLQDALASDHLIAMALLTPGWEKDYWNHPAIYSTVCIGRIIHHAETSDGRHNIFLRGLSRARILTESRSPAGYRIAQVEPVAEPTPMVVAALHRYRPRLVAALGRRLNSTPSAPPASNATLEAFNVAQITDVLCHELELPVEQKQALLEEVCLEQRIETVLKIADALQTLDTLKIRPTRLACDEPLKLPKNLLN